MVCFVPGTLAVKANENFSMIKPFQGGATAEARKKASKNWDIAAIELQPHERPHVRIIGPLADVSVCTFIFVTCMENHHTTRLQLARQAHLLGNQTCVCIFMCWLKLSGLTAEPIYWSVRRLDTRTIKTAPQAAPRPSRGSHLLCDSVHNHRFPVLIVSFPEFARG